MKSFKFGNNFGEIGKYVEVNGFLTLSMYGVISKSSFSTIEEAYQYTLFKDQMYKIIETNGFETKGHTVNISENDTCEQVALKVSKEIKDYQTVKREYEQKKCTHEFKQYIGMKEQFEYCVKCDVKK